MPSAESLAGLGIPTLQDTGRSESASVNPADVVDPAPPVVKRPAKQKDVPLQLFIVGEGLPAVPAKLVAKIQRGECQHGRALKETTSKRRDAILPRKGSRVARFQRATREKYQIY